MLSRAQQPRVLEVLRDCPSGTLRTYCLDHLAAAVKIPPTHAGDLVAFVQTSRAQGDCEGGYVSFCDAGGHETDDLLVWMPDSSAQGVR